MSKETTKSIAEKLVAYCSQNDDERCLNELYDENAISVEAAIMPGEESAETKGLDAIRAKHEWWNNTFEVNSADAQGPFLHGNNRFGVIFSFDATNKETGDRESMTELGIYTVENDKIIREEFFYNT